MQVRLGSARVAEVIATVSLVLPATAFAQQASVTPSVDVAAPVPAAGQTPGVADNGGVQDIVVTAQRRNESSQKVPIAITAVTAEFAANVGVKSAVDIQMVAPSVNWGSTVGGASVSIRGISGTGSAGDESANAVYVDGVYNPVGGSLMFGFNNIARVEVLKGPQGTLFGRNASGGAIQVITRDPSHTTSVDASVGYSRFDTIEGSFYGTTGLTDTLAADFSFYDMHMGKGWGRNVFTGNDAYKGKTLAFRSKWLWEADPSTKLTFIASYNSNTPAPSGGINLLPNQGHQYFGFYNINDDLDLFNTTKQDNLSLKIEHEFDWATIVNIASHDHTKTTYLVESDASPAAIAANGFGNSKLPSHSVTEELQILSPSSSSIKWVGGLYYYYNDFARDPLIFQGLAFPGGKRTIFSRMETNSYSGYGQATAPIVANLKLTGGLRYTIDRRNITAHKTETAANVPVNYVVVATGQVVPVIHQNTSDKKLTWHGSLDNQFTPDVLGYVSATRGFKSGFFNITAPETPAVKPQVVDAYEVGLKTTVLDHKLRLNLAAYTNNFKNIQLRRVTSSGAFFLNAATARIRGVDLDFEARPLSHLTLQGGATYLDGRYRSFPGGPVYSFVNGVFRESTADLAGKRTIRTPTFSGSLGAVYTIESSAGKFITSVNGYYNRGFYFDPQNRVRQPSYTIINASLGWTSVGGKFDAKVWGKNILDKKYFTDFNTTGGVGDLYYPAAPATYGVTLGVHF